METANGIFSKVPYASSGAGADKMKGKEKGIKTEKINISGSRIPKRRRITLSTVIAKAKAYMHFKGIKSALKEVEMMRSGKIKAKPIDDLINEL